MFLLKKVMVPGRHFECRPGTYNGNLMLETKPTLPRIPGEEGLWRAPPRNHRWPLLLNPCCEPFWLKIRDSE
jgi:hypothetical protein